MSGIWPGLFSWEAGLDFLGLGKTRPGLAWFFSAWPGLGLFPGRPAWLFAAWEKPGRAWGKPGLAWPGFSPAWPGLGFFPGGAEKNQATGLISYLAWPDLGSFGEAPEKPGHRPGFFGLAWPGIFFCGGCKKPGRRPELSQAKKSRPRKNQARPKRFRPPA